MQVFCVCVLRCLAETSHRVTGSCLAFWMKRSRAGRVREGQSHSGILDSLLQPQGATPAWLLLFFPFSFSPLSSFFFSIPFLPTLSCKSLFLQFTLLFFPLPSLILFLPFLPVFVSSLQLRLVFYRRLTSKSFSLLPKVPQLFSLSLFLPLHFSFSLAPLSCCVPPFFLS